mgnify:CR=1 FL=1
MSPFTHFLVGWAVAEATPNTSVKERTLIALAGVIPDLDGIGVVVDGITKLTSDEPTQLFATYHHDLHTLAFALVCSGLALLALGRGPALGRRLLVGALVALSFHLHLLCDVAGSRGPDGHQWPIPYLKPFNNEFGITWSGQWVLNAWPNMALTVALLAATLVLAVRRGYSPLEIVSAKADQAVVQALRARFAPHRLEPKQAPQDASGPAPVDGVPDPAQHDPAQPDPDSPA